MVNLLSFENIHFNTISNTCKMGVFLQIFSFQHLVEQMSAMWGDINWRRISEINVSCQILTTYILTFWVNKAKANYYEFVFFLLKVAENVSQNLIWKKIIIYSQTTMISSFQMKKKTIDMEKTPFKLNLHFHLFSSLDIKSDELHAI